MNDPSLAVRILSPRNLLALAAGFGVYYGATLRNPAILAVGVAMGAALAVAAWSASRLLKDVRVERTHPTRAFEGQHVPVVLRVFVEADRRLSLLLVEDTFSPGSPFRMRHLVERPLERGADVRIAFEGECIHKRGLYMLGPVRFEAFDPMGLMKRELFVEEFTPMLVYPSAPDLHVFEVLGEGTLPHVGRETTRRAGNSTEFTGLRQYRVGDNPSTIHWRSSARVGELMVKEFQEDMTTEVSIFLDLGRLGLTGLGDQTSVEYAIKAASSVARRAIEKSHLVQVYAIGEETEHIPLGRGTRQLHMILDRLSFVKAEGDSRFVEKVAAIVPTLRRGGTVVLAVGVTTIRAQAMAPLLDAMRRRNLLPIVVLVDDRAFIKLYREQESQHIEAMSLEDTARFLTLEGARVHVVTKAKSPAQALVQGLDRSFLARD